MTAEGYRALREGLAAYRPPRDLLAVTGSDAAGYLQGQCSQDLTGLAVGGAADSLLLEPDGKLAALVRLVRTADDGFVVEVDAGYGETVATRLGRFKLRSKVVIDRLDWPYVALRGPGAGPVAVDGGWAIPYGWNGVTGIDLLGPGAEAAVPEGARWVDDEDWEAVRVEAGIPAMGRELDGRTIAAEAGLVERTVSFTKGCYTGQELVARLDARGSRVARRLCGLLVTGGPEDPSVLVSTELWVADRDRPVGAVTSAVRSPATGGTVALGYLHRSVEDGAEVEVRTTATAPASARVVALPIVP